MTATQDLVAISGNTYPVKDQLKALGARWNGDLKSWMVSPEKAEQARGILAAAGPAKPFSGVGAYRPSRCRSCGCAGSRYNPIYRSGDCKDCWVSEKEEREMGY